MVRPILLLCLASVSFAADEQQLALTLQAQSDFDRVEMAAPAVLADTARCIQSQAALLSIAPRTESALLHFRKGYCTLARAEITDNKNDYLEAAGEFDKAVATWPDRFLNIKNAVPQPVSSGLVVLADVARLKAEPPVTDFDRPRREIQAAIDPPHCSSNVMPAAMCDTVTSAGRLWLGWLSLQQNDLFQAERDLSGVSGSPWSQWVAGSRAFADRNYKQAAALYGQAVRSWQSEHAIAVIARVAPQPQMAQVLTDWGGAQLLAGDSSGALATLDAAVKADPSLARAYYLRARAKELAGHAEQALADYNLAGRTAFAKSPDLASGEAHLYRGIAEFRRKQYEQAEDEFENALNFSIPAQLRPDAAAWRLMAAVAEGSCSDSPRLLEDSLTTVSPYFPKQEARTLASRCPLTGISSAATALPPR